MSKVVDPSLRLLETGMSYFIRKLTGDSNWSHVSNIQFEKVGKNNEDIRTLTYTLKGDLDDGLLVTTHLEIRIIFVARVDIFLLNKFSVTKIAPHLSEEKDAEILGVEMLEYYGYKPANLEDAVAKCMPKKVLTISRPSDLEVLFKKYQHFIRLYDYVICPRFSKLDIK
jgi:hypothetical protein